MVKHKILKLINKNKYDIYLKEIGIHNTRIGYNLLKNSQEIILTKNPTDAIRFDKQFSNSYCDVIIDNKIIELEKEFGLKFECVELVIDVSKGKK